jgi:hypothetical protein
VAGVLWRRFWRRHRTWSQPPPPPERGWQFYRGPTEEEPPGTVFRIDEAGVRFPVKTLEVEARTAHESFPQRNRQLDSNLGLIARLLGVPAEVDVRASKTESFLIDLDDVTREYIEDVELDRVLAREWSEALVRPGNRYYVIRESLSATAVKIELQEEQVQALGGGGTIDEAAELKGSLHASRSHGTYKLNERYGKPRRVLFLPDKLDLSGARDNTARITIDRKPVDEVLDWTETRRRDTELDFLIEELVTPLATLLGKPWFDAVAPDVSDGMRAPLLRLVRQLSTSDATSATVRDAQDEFFHIVEQTPGGEAELATIARRRPRVSISSDADQALRELEQYYAVLAFVCDRVGWLNHPVALRGFFSCTDCVAVIDFRPHDGTPNPPERPRPAPLSDLPPQIMLAASWTDAVLINRPRIWLIRAEPDKRDRLVDALNDRYRRRAGYQTQPLSLNDELADDAAEFGLQRPEFVSSIERGVVQIVVPTAPGPSPNLPIGEYVQQFMARPSPETEHDRFFEINTPAGIELMRDDLERLLRDRWKSDLEWR